MKHLQAERTHECFYLDGQRWEHRSSGAWTRSDGSSSRPGYRNGRDPTLVLESLAALTDIQERTPGVEVRGTPTTRLRVRADLRTVEDRLEDFLDIGDTRGRAAGWYEAAPVNIWIDDSGLPRRVSYAPVAANTTEPFWWTIELFDFGTAVKRPRLLADGPNA